MKEEKWIVANWKMNNVLNTSNYLTNLNDSYKSTDLQKKTKTNIVICPPFVYFNSFKNMPKDFYLGAQNCNENLSGAHTGEISVDFLKDFGVDYVLIGHSERRSIYNESNEVIKEKIKIAHEKDIKVIFCIGENAVERKSGYTETVLTKQISESLSQDLDFSKILIAYEPVWAIGSNTVASIDIIDNAHLFIKNALKETFKAENVPILYGGSVNSKNFKEIDLIENVDGVLIGGASLKEDEMVKILKNT